MCEPLESSVGFLPTDGKVAIGKKERRKEGKKERRKERSDPCNDRPHVSSMPVFRMDLEGNNNQ